MLKGLTVVTMEKIMELLSNLNEQLKKHPDVNSVYRQPAKNEIDFKNGALNDNYDLYSETWRAFATNLKMLRKIEFERQDENKPTVDVLNAAESLLQYTTFDENSILLMIEEREKILLFIDTSAMMVIFCVNCQITRRISTIMDDELVMKDLIGGRAGKQIYRGVSNSGYGLIPTMYRGISIGSGFGVVNSTKLKNLYINANLLSKYKEVFGKDDVDYAFCAFAQHSKSYSPLLDFTEDVKVALSFATTNSGSINDYERNDAALYCMSFDEIDSLEQIDFSDIDIFINEKRISMFSIIRGKMLFQCTYDDFRVEAFILTDKTNDRMKYQKGCFLYFKRAVIINGNLLFPINFGRIRKYIIPVKGNTLTKRKIAEKIKSDYKYFLPQYLMDPYRYFEEAPL